MSTSNDTRREKLLRSYIRHMLAASEVSHQLAASAFERGHVGGSQAWMDEADRCEEEAERASESLSEEVARSQGWWDDPGIKVNEGDPA